MIPCCLLRWFTSLISAQAQVLRFTLACLLVLSPGCFLGRTNAEDHPDSSAVDFEKQIHPILTEKCLACHGQDAGTRESGLRLDLRSDALIGGDSGIPAIVPGQADRSEMIRRISTLDNEERMPPVHSNLDPLSESELQLLESWVNSGAPYAEHWAFSLPKKRSSAQAETFETASDAIDGFVAERLSSLGLSRSPRAELGQLCRRLYLDLIGLPPSDADLSQFVRDGYSATVDRLLQSDRFGEKWARLWLDAARYSDTNGYEKDLRRDQWIWRDWVIQSLNSDLPYDQFIIQQIAGDLLPNATQDHVVATGMLRNSMINEEGAIVPEEFRMAEMFDRMDCIGKSVLGITIQCAQCHSHKFDPLSQEEYYGMFAFLNNTYEAQSWIYTDDQLKTIEEIEQAIAEIDDQIRSVRSEWQMELQDWESGLRIKQAQWLPLQFHDLNSVSGLNHPVQQTDGSILMLGHRSDDVYFVGKTEFQGITGMRLEVLCHNDLPFTGPGRNEFGGWNIREIEVFLQPPDGSQWQQVPLVNASADYSEVEQTLEEGKKKRGPVSFLIDGKDDTAWQADRGLGRRNVPSLAVIQFDKPIDAPVGSQLKFAMRMSDMVGCCRVSLTQDELPGTPAIDYGAQLALRVPTDDRDARQRAAVFRAWCRGQAELEPFEKRIDEIYSRFPTARTSVLHFKEREPDNARETFVLSRGEWHRPENLVQPCVPAAWHPMTISHHGNPQEPARLRFARWLVDPRSPLAARVAVNRIWQSIFGTGLVETSEDFGTRTAPPEYREILDWLAVDLMTHGWSQKYLIRQIVSSQTYQQSSVASLHMMSDDPDNRLLQRGPRFRADAEVVRDMALAISGLLHHELGGPSVIPPVPQNVLDYNYTYPSYWTPATGPQRYRRTVYNFRKRSMPDPAMSTLDAPNGDFSCVRRIRSNTPLAALTGLNEPVFVESARGLALRLLREVPAEDRKRIDLAYQLCMSRLPTDEERSILLELLGSNRKRIAEGWLNAREIATGDGNTLPELPEGATPQDAAAWTLTARVLLNLDETISKN